VSKRINIIAFDPGEQTGWARGYVTQAATPHLHVEAAGWDAWKAVLLAYAKSMLGEQWPPLLGGGITEPTYQHTVYESWRVRPDAAQSLIGSDLQSSQFIGGMKLCVWRCQQAGRVAELHTNEPGNKPSIDGWMEKAGMGDYLPSSQVDHNRDALRHLYFHAIKRLGVREEDCHDDTDSDSRAVDGEVLDD